VDCEHGDLPRKRSAFDAYLELLERGKTERLETVAIGSAVRGAASVAAAAARVRSRPSRLKITSEPPRRPGDVLAKERRTLGSAAGRQTPLRITVTHGDLTFVSEPLLLGHYQASKLTGTEAAMDKHVGQTMSEALKRGLYPTAPGSHQVFLNTRANPDNPWQLPRPKAVVVVGLGQEGSLRPPDLVSTVRQAVMAWSQRLAEEPDAPDLFSIAATLIGSGGVSVTVADSAQLVAKGVREANERLDDDDETTRWPRVEHLTLIELYLDRATEAWRALTLQAESSPASYVVTGPVQTGSGGLRRLLDAAYRGAPYDFMSVTSGEAGPGASQITYALDTTRARTEITGQSTQSRLIQTLVLSGSSAENADPLLGKTLFTLLVPPEIEAFLGGVTEMQIELDRGTAGIPWELLDTEIPGGSDSRPWAIRTKLLRKLRTGSYRSRVVDADAESGVLIIGEPQCAAVYPDLPAARREAAAVAAKFGSGRVAAAGFTSTIRSLIRPDGVGAPGPDARTILNAVMSRHWRIVHISGHGEPPELVGPVPKTAADPPQTHGAPRGVVLSDDLFLGPHEIKSMRVVPELVFVNCCFLAARGIGELLAPGEWRYRPYNRAQFASTVADALIDIGVRCVIAAGWAVEDGPASVFAETFYDSLLTGHRFIDAVAVAREAAEKMGGNTWAAYQCYGDPDWTFRPGVGDAQRPGKAYGDEFAAIASPESLVLALHTIGVNSEFNRAAEDAQVDRLRYLETRFRAAWGGIGMVAAAFGRAWSLMGQRAPAIEWLTRARAAQDATAPLAALEELANLQVRSAWETVERAAPGRARKAALGAARDQIEEARTLLDTLLALGPTIERENLYGSAFKRLAMVEAEAGEPDAEGKAIEGMKRHYGTAEQLARQTNAADLYYPAMNRMAAELALLAGRRRGASFRPEEVAAARASLTAAALQTPGFWSVVGQTELTMYEALSAGTLATSLATLTTQFKALHERVPRARKSWASVYDNATFVLQKYRAHAPAPEKSAAATLLTLLKSFAATT
jgi:tetratricopeptide (TPR) repeat protein